MKKYYNQFLNYLISLSKEATPIGINNGIALVNSNEIEESFQLNNQECIPLSAILFDFHTRLLAIEKQANK